MKEIIEKLIKLNKTISVMESCTGGAMSNEITNTPNSSLVFKVGLVTYSNEYKIKFGVDSNLIDKYSVYSKEVSIDMSKKVTMFSNSNYGIGITGKLLKEDPNNLKGDIDCVYYSIYDKDKDIVYSNKVIVNSKDRIINKDLVVKSVINDLNKII